MESKIVDCHRLSELDKCLGKRVIVETKKGTCRGWLHYLDGWYFIPSCQMQVEGEFVFSPYKFMFRKGQFKKIKIIRGENSNGV